MTAPAHQPRILVVCHEASRTGAPRVAVEILKALGQGNWDRHVVLRWPGPLMGELAGTGAKMSMEPLRRLRALRRWRLTRSLTAYLEMRLAALVIWRVRPDVIWCNTVTSACYIKPGLRRGLGVVLHGHETLDRTAEVLARYHVEGQWSSTILVGCAPQACESLAEVTGRRRDEVEFLPSVPDSTRVVALARDQPVEREGGILIGACGTADRRKGVDLWLELVAQVGWAAVDLDPHFVWIGGDAPDNFLEWSSATGLGARVTFTGSLENPYPWLAALDVFTLTSRADPFPLVVLEAMHLGRPVVAFAVGDVPSQIGDTGRLIPPLDVADAADAVIELLRDESERCRLGDAAAARAREQFTMTDFSRGVQRIANDAMSAAKRHSGTRHSVKERR